MDLSTYVKTDSGCWEWSGAKCAGGRYGRVVGSGLKGLVMAHRASYEMHKGHIPCGMCICHTCDNGLCINPEHLFIGTISDNQSDAYQKGRSHMNRLHEKSQRGENNPNVKLTQEIVDAIRKHHKETGCSYRELALEFGLKSKGHGYNIVNGYCWT